MHELEDAFLYSPQRWNKSMELMILRCEFFSPQEDPRQISTPYTMKKLLGLKAMPRGMLQFKLQKVWGQTTMFAVCACGRFQVTPKASHLNAVKWIFRYLKHQPKLGLWYPKDSPFELEAYSDGDYGGASLDRKSTTSGCQFLGRRLISWQCKKQTIVANSTTEAEYVAAARCWKVTPLFDSMLVQQIEDEGDASERPSDSQPIPSPPHPSEDQPQIQPNPSPKPSPTIHIPDSILEGSGGNHGGQSSNDASLSGNEDGKEAIERSQTTYHTSQSLDEDKIGKEAFSKEKGGTQGVYMDDTLDYMETKDDQNKGRTSSVVLEKKESADKEVSIEASISTDKQDEGTNKKHEGTDKQDGSIDSTKVSTDRQGERTANETIAQGLIIMSQNKEKLKEKEKGVEIRNIEDTERPKPTSTRSILTLRPLPKIDPKDKGKKRIEEENESDTESKGITKAEKKIKQLANDEEEARKVQEEWEAEEEKKGLAKEVATKVALTNEYDFIQARINADKILAEELQKEEREKSTIEQREDV
ncbi:hypothetical protein Tco_0624658 [Tanacetum coccineum]|uniref:Uncharacterized protein n=1 Tax=Tanacetum coccineum TaxID=301880 RepID=A0ABQ4WEJ5_9ASTR